MSAQAFPGLGARLSRYSYLVSLLPEQIVRELELPLELRSRRTASYSPTVRDGEHLGLFVERDEGAVTRESFRRLTGSDEEYDAWRAFYAEMGELAGVVAPTLTAPLPSADLLRERVGGPIWDQVVERPLGEVIERRFTDDLVRGVVATDALIGTFADLHDPSLVQNRCFLYHLIGNGTGEWKVPVGGMGAVTKALLATATKRGAEVLTDASVTAIRADADGAEVTWDDGAGTHVVQARQVLSNVAPWTLQGLLGEEQSHVRKPAGSQLKINFLLSRLPRLRSGHDPLEAFAGTLHVAEEYSALNRSFAEAASGSIPSSPPGEFYCHSLTDPSILGDLADDGVHTLTYFGLDMPADAVPPGPCLPTRRGRTPRDRRGRRTPRRAAARLRAGRTRRPPVHRGQGAAGRRGRPRDARRPHLPRRPRVALGHGLGGPRHPSPAVGRRDRCRLRAALRVRRPQGRRSERPGWAQRGPGSPRHALGFAASGSGPEHPRPISSRRPLTAKVPVASSARAISSIGRAADS